MVVAVISIALGVIAMLLHFVIKSPGYVFTLLEALFPEEHEHHGGGEARRNVKEN